MITLLFGSHSMHALTIGRANPVSQPIELPTTHNERSTPAPNEWAAVSIGINLPPRFASECLAPVLARAHDRSRSVVLLLAHHQLAWSRPPFGEKQARFITLRFRLQPLERLFGYKE